MTDRAVFDFRAKEFASGTPYIHAAWLSGPEILDGTLGFDLVKGTTLDQAKEIAAYLNIRGIFNTRSRSSRTQSRG
jgi:hypothetical protein